VYHNDCWSLIQASSQAQARVTPVILSTYLFSLLQASEHCFDRRTFGPSLPVNMGLGVLEDKVLDHVPGKFWSLVYIFTESIV
jgi:hypothetical protein